MPNNQNDCASSYQKEPENCTQIAEKNFELFPDTESFKDYSSTFFVKKADANSGSLVLRMELSGNTMSIPYNRELMDLLEGTTNTPIMSDIYGGKVVVIPVKDSSEKTVGAIIREVIE